MLEKKLQLIVAFDKTIDSMNFESYCLNNKINGRLIPLPQEISEGCGLCWKTDTKDKDLMTESLKNAKIEKYNFYEIKI